MMDGKSRSVRGFAALLILFALLAIMVPLRIGGYIERVEIEVETEIGTEIEDVPRSPGGAVAGHGREGPTGPAAAPATTVGETSVYPPTPVPDDRPVTPTARDLQPSAPPPTPTPSPTVPPPTPTLPWAELLVSVNGTVKPPAEVGKALVVDQDGQVLRVYEDSVEVRVLPVSTGKPPLYTPAYSGRVRHYVGTFYSQGLWVDNAWYVFFASAEILIHSAPYTLSGEEKEYQGLEHLGVRPSSHGCIRLYPDDAQWLTDWDPHWVPIVITPLDLDKEW